MRLLHYSPKCVDRVYSVENQSVDWKPNGFWVSVEGLHDWPSFCSGIESFKARINKALIYEVTLQSSHKVLLLDSPSKLKRFAKSYSAPLFSFKFPPHLAKLPMLNGISWERVASRYQGVIIAPYVRMRFEHTWYDSWDCASGCIWDANAIKSLNKVDRPNKR